MKRKPVAVAVVVILIGALGLFFAGKSFTGGLKLPRLGPECTVRADGEVTLDSVQMANAATISAVGMRRKMPERAVVVALATAFQESKLENLDTGDRDSLGLFQQRPSQGWGTPEKIQDPRYAADKFYAALKKVKGWKTMRVTDAAQKVQRSAFPNAYEKWADESEVLARALTGRATGAVECTVSGKPALRGAAAAAALAEVFTLDWGIEATTAADVTVAVKDPSSGWRYAHWLVSHAETTGLERVRFADREWTAPDGKWQPVTGDRRVGSETVVAEVFR
ncbi:hypothetical protein [Couchioplanes caeruleus]|uniref:Heavy metal transporter n=2 Tax=Couchioplanes caeruleus TaxID=56438 RepID=A0A1K0GBJ6_9ACTN|nr:hypothetical protein [Couchioplanes caeruleus]OJF09542.1 hypothetical protein BG844_37005 [Couchioplanes caeruleus subsp. caeruleus]ROP29608.1 hypothetical protein EDD30_2409 [Couchioplanes caeruleus]